jgi:hypothetical protein
MKKIIVSAFIIALSFSASAQKTKLVADETNLISLKNSFKIESSNSFITSALIKEFKTVMSGHRVKLKTNRKAQYEVVTIKFKPEYLTKVNQFFNNLNK